MYNIVALIFAIGLAVLTAYTTVLPALEQFQTLFATLPH